MTSKKNEILPVVLLELARREEEEEEEKVGQERAVAAFGRVLLARSVRLQPMGRPAMGAANQLGESARFEEPLRRCQGVSYLVAAWALLLTAVEVERALRVVAAALGATAGRGAAGLLERGPPSAARLFEPWEACLLSEVEEKT